MSKTNVEIVISYVSRVNLEQAKQTSLEVAQHVLDQHVRDRGEYGISIPAGDALVRITEILDRRAQIKALLT